MELVCYIYTNGDMTKHPKGCWNKGAKLDCEWHYAYYLRQSDYTFNDMKKEDKVKK
jgi:hypothetical protein